MDKAVADKRTADKSASNNVPVDAVAATDKVPADAAAADTVLAGKRRGGRRGGSGQAGSRPPEPAADRAPSEADVAQPAGENGSAETAPEATDEERRQRALDLVMETLEALLAERGDNDTIWGSMVKQTLKRRQPGFNESYYGYRSFNALLEDAQARGLIALTRDDKSGGVKLRLAERVE
jgi:hypothetical protein